MPQEIGGEGSEILPLCRNRVVRCLQQLGSVGIPAEEFRPNRVAMHHPTTP